MNLHDIRTVYFVGIGGIGMSALARYFLRRGVKVHGYDRTETALTRQLTSEGAAVHYNDDPGRLPAAIDLAIYTPAVPATMRELALLREKDIPLVKRAEALGIISRGHKTAAVAGTHGKTTTSSMLAHLLRSGGVDCTAFLGGIARNFESNFVAGSGEWIVVEADEYDRSFLHLRPDIAIILSMDPDHLDIYGDEEQLLSTGFLAFAGQVNPDGGQLWANANLRDRLSNFPSARYFGLEQGACRAMNIRVKDGDFVFDLEIDALRLEDLRLPMPGRHNVENACAALAAASQIGVAPERLRQGLATFKGIQRRFEIVYRDERRIYIDDYAHHPTELRAAIAAAREYLPGKKLTGIFQPHLYSRTRDFADGFAQALDALDEIILLDIYPAREAPIPGVGSELIFNAMRNPNRQLCDKARLMEVLKNVELEALLSLGAGDIDTFAQPIADHLRSLARGAGSHHRKSSVT
jgi:UDP-N-acetylmuramate--alanine ligase